MATQDDATLAFEALREERAALDPEKLVQINADIPTAVTIALGTFERLRSLRALVVEKLPRHEMRHWDGLQTYALAALHAHVVSTAPEGSDEKARVKSLLDEAASLRKKLLVAAEAIAHAGVFDADRVARIRSGAGNVDRGVDLIALAALYTERWAEVENRTMVTKQEVQRARVLGPALLEALGAKLLADRRSAAKKRDDRARAFTLLVHAYETCQQAVAYLRFRERDAGAYTPSLRPRPRRLQPRPARRGAIRWTPALTPLPEPEVASESSQPRDRLPSPPSAGERERAGESPRKRQAGRSVTESDAHPNRAHPRVVEAQGGTGCASDRWYVSWSQGAAGLCTQLAWQRWSGVSKESCRADG